MASSKNRQFIFTLILTILATTSFGLSAINETVMPQGFLPFASKHIVIINKLGVRETLDVHCKNKEKDLGFVSLAPGASFEFKFRTNLRQTTKYTCRFWWPSAPHVLWFDIFAVNRDDNVCKVCVWYAFDGMICRVRRDNGQPTFCSIWNPNK